jgi:hypothetical protein
LAFLKKNVAFASFHPFHAQKKRVNPKANPPNLLAALTKTTEQTKAVV